MATTNPVNNIKCSRCNKVRKVHEPKTKACPEGKYDPNTKTYASFSTTSVFDMSVGNRNLPWNTK